MSVTTSDIDQRTLVLTRTLNAPARLVFMAWSHPHHLAKWWGPSGFTLPHCEQDFRVGGKYRCCMRAPDGSDHWVRGEYLEITDPSRLVFTWLREDERGEIWCDNVVALSFEERNGRTTLTLNQTAFATVPHCDEHRDGWDQCLDRLVEYVHAQPTSTRTNNS